MKRFQIFLLPGTLVAGVILLPMLISGCTSERSGEELRADSLLAAIRTEPRMGPARILLLQAFALHQGLDRPEAMAEETELLAENYFATAEFDSAVYYYDLAYDYYYKRAANRPGARRVRLAVASLLRTLGQEQDAYEMYAEMLRIARVLGDTEAITDIQWAMLPSCRAVRRFDEENGLLTELLDRSTQESNLRMQARVYSEWGQSFSERGMYDQAVENFLRAVTLSDQAGDSLLAIHALNRLAHNYTALNRTTEAFQVFTDGLTRSDRTRGAGALRQEMLGRVGNVYLRSRTFNDAERFFRSALAAATERGDKLAEGYLFVQLGHCYVANRKTFEDGIKSYTMALDLFNSYGYDPGRSYALSGLGLAALSAGRLVDANDLLARAVESCSFSPVPDPRTSLYAECEQVFWDIQQSSLNEKAVETLLLLGKSEEAFVLSERADGRYLAEVTSEFGYETGRRETTAVLWQFQRERSRYNGALRKLAAILSIPIRDQFPVQQIRAALDRYRRAREESAARIASLDPSLESLVNPATRSFADIQQSLPPATVLFKPVFTSRNVHLFAFRNSGVTIQISPLDKPALQNRSSEYQDILFSSAQAPDSVGLTARAASHRVAELSGSLYAALIRPVESVLAGAKQLVVVAPRPGVPIHTLRPAGRRSPYLIERVAVCFVPRAAALRREEWSPAPLSIVAMGYAGNTQWDVEYELRDIRAFHKDARLYFQKQATPSNLQREQGTILHLAAEFSFDPAFPRNSFWHLSDGQGNSPLKLQWGMILSLQGFSAVVLSDLGKHANIPAAQAELFLVAGSRSVITTLYSAQRRTKKFFGELFYTALTGGSSPEDAYRSAVMGMIGDEDYAAPPVWAPFVLWGR